MLLTLLAFLIIKLAVFQNCDVGILNIFKAKNFSKKFCKTP